MTPEAQRIAIAEWCGWTRGQMLVWFNPNAQPYSKPPDYLNDLNCMHEAERNLDQNQSRVYTQNLSEICFENGLQSFGACEWIWHATASQRAEALLRTIGKWQDDPTPVCCHPI